MAEPKPQEDDLLGNVRWWLGKLHPDFLLKTLIVELDQFLESNPNKAPDGIKVFFPQSLRSKIEVYAVEQRIKEEQRVELISLLKTVVEKYKLDTLGYLE